MRLRTLAAIVPVLLLGACSGAPLPPPPLLPVASRGGQGIDLANDTGDILNELKASRVDFVARYYREPDSRWPALSAGEAQLLSAAGLKIVAVFEGHSADPEHFSYWSGYHDAMAAAGQARAIGQPPGSAIYFAVDFNALSLDPIDQYFQGVAASLAAAGGGQALYKIGVYGSGTVCARIKGSGLAQYSWLTNSLSWDGSTSYEDWDISQGGPSPELSFNHDSDEARTEYGGFRLADLGVVSAVVPSR